MGKNGLGKEIIKKEKKILILMKEKEMEKNMMKMVN